MYAGQIRMAVLKQLVKLEATKIFIKLLMELKTKSVSSPDVLVSELLCILGQLSQTGNETKSKVTNTYFDFLFYNGMCFKISNFQNMPKP